LLGEVNYQTDQDPSSGHTPSSFDISAVLKTHPIGQGSQMISLTAEGLQLAREIDGLRNLATIAQELSWPQSKAIKIAQQLFDQEVVFVMGNEIIDEGFIHDLTDALILLIGPIGQVITDDALADIKATPRNLRKNQVATFVAEVVKQLSQREWQTYFLTEAKRIGQNYSISL
jgi:hypothetical protein